MNSKLIAFLVLVFSNACFGAEYEMLWDHDGLNIDISMARAPSGVATRVAEFGVLTPNISLPTIRKLAENKVELRAKEEGIVYLFIKNNESKTLRFSVAPHGTHPAESALGFHFNCLCNGHIYEVPSGKTWYRIMQIKVSTDSKGPVILRHKIFRVKKSEMKNS